MRIRLDFRKQLVSPISFQDMVEPRVYDSSFGIEWTGWRTFDEIPRHRDGQLFWNPRFSEFERYSAELEIASAITDAVVELLCDEEEAESWRDCLFVAIWDEVRASPEEFDAFELVIRAMTRLFAAATDTTIPSEPSYPKTVVSKYKAPSVTKPRFHRKGDRDNGMCLWGNLPLQCL